MSRIEGGSRIERIRKHHPYIHPGWLRAMLCIEYNKAIAVSKTNSVTSDVYEYLEAFVRATCRAPEDEVLNMLAVTQEQFVGFDPDAHASEDELDPYIEYMRATS